MLSHFAKKVLTCCQAASGVGILDECLRAYDEVKMGHRWLYIIFRVSEDLKICVDEKGGHGESSSSRRKREDRRDYKTKKHGGDYKTKRHRRDYKTGAYRRL